MNRAQQQRYDASLNAARQWAAHVAFDELRKSNAPRVARSYGITEADAQSIIVSAHRARRV